MLVYWLLYLIPASLALFLSRNRQFNLIYWIIIGTAFVLIIGFRYEVGGDWISYLAHYNDMLGMSLNDALVRGDPGHKFINWLMYQWNLGVYGTNVIYGTIFMLGMVKFSRAQTYPWLTLVAAVPYLIIVVVMGYSRQGAAIGLFLLAISYLQNGKFKTYIVFILLAALFHKTAILLLPLGMFLYGKGLTFRILMIIPIAYGAWDLLLAEQQERLWKNYVEAQMHSTGAMIRVFMNLVPSLLLLLYRKEWKRNYNDYSFWFWIAIGSILAVALVDFATTAVDRIGLYLIPIQLVVFARLPFLARNKISPQEMKIMIVLGYMAVLFVWLNFGRLSYAWIPYQNILWMDIL